MTAKEYLLKIEYYDDRIERDESELERLYACAYGNSALDYTKDKVTVSTDPGKIAEIVSLIEQFSDDKAKCILERAKIIWAIQQIPNKEAARIIYLRYVEYLKYPRMKYVERITPMSKGTFYKYYNMGLDSVAQTLN